MCIQQFSLTWMVVSLRLVISWYSSCIIASTTCRRWTCKVLLATLPGMSLNITIESPTSVLLSSAAVCRRRALYTLATNEWRTVFWTYNAFKTMYHAWLLYYNVSFAVCFMHCMHKVNFLYCNDYKFSIHYAWTLLFQSTITNHYYILLETWWNS